MARYASLLIAVAATLAVAAASASAYARAADSEELLTITVGDDSGDKFGLVGGAIGRRRLDDLNGTSADAANATSTDSNATSTGAGAGAGGFTGFISYLALSADRVPCDQRGASYYSNCQPGAEANPYSRGCSAITQCRG